MRVKEGQSKHRIKDKKKKNGDKSRKNLQFGKNIYLYISSNQVYKARNRSHILFLFLLAGWLKRASDDNDGRLADEN